MWGLERNALRDLEYAVKNIGLTDDQKAEYAAAINISAADPSRVLSISSGVASINVHGLLTKGRHFMSMFMGGGTSYGEIISAIASAEADPDVERIEFNIDSPGGTVAGMFEAMDAIRDVPKPTKAIISSVGASAAFGLASQADEIVAKSRATRIGSVGVAASFMVWPEDVDIASTQAPKKRPDLTTEEGKAIVREELDGIHNLFVEAIAKGRKTTEKKVNSDFGRGATVLAGEALTSGMIDSIAESGQILSDVEEETETTGMNIDELKAKYPDIYQAVLKEGAEAERDRVSAHLTMGEASGDMTTALAAVEDGSAMTSAIQAKYMAAGMSRKDVANRQDDDDDASAADNADDDDDVDAQAEAVASIVEKNMGVSANA